MFYDQVIVLSMIKGNVNNTITCAIKGQDMCSMICSQHDENEELNRDT
jgi:hypothetical protein